MIPLPKRYTVQEAAAELKMSPASVMRDIAAGELACYRLGPKRKIILIGEHHIAEYLACRETRKPSGSATTSSASAGIAPIGAPVGTIRPHPGETSVAQASARATFARRR